MPGLARLCDAPQDGQLSDSPAKSARLRLVDGATPKPPDLVLFRLENGEHGLGHSFSDLTGAAGEDVDRRVPQLRPRVQREVAFRENQHTRDALRFKMMEARLHDPSAAPGSRPDEQALEIRRIVEKPVRQSPEVENEVDAQHP